MKRSPLAVAMAIVAFGMLSNTAIASPSAHGVVPLGKLYTLLDVAADRVTEAPSTAAPVLWFTDQALMTPRLRQSALAAYRRGVPVAILRGPVDATTDSVLQGIFGVSSTAQVAVYLRGEDAGPQIHSIAELPAAGEARVNVVAHWMAGIVASSGGVTASPDQPGHVAASDEAELVALPRLAFTDTQYAASGNGASSTVRGEVVRDSTRSTDRLIISGSSSHNLKPHHNGQSGSSVIVPGNYHHFLRLSTLDNRHTSPTLEGAKPTSSPSTEIKISESHTTTTSYGFGLSREISAGLEGKVPSFGAKASFSFDFSRAYASTNALEFSVMDYSIAASASAPAAQTSMAYWDLPLAPKIASKPDYFGRTPNTGNMTPSMRQVTAQGSSFWSVPGDFSGTLSLTAGARIDNLEFRGSTIDKVPDPRPQPTAGVTFRADSPYLTREVTVFIQAKAGNGGCLRDQGGVVGIAPCPDVTDPNWMDDLHAQWQLDSHGRYYNRGSRYCMQLLTSGNAPGGGGEIVTRPCSTNRDQRWEWQADRIHSLHGDGHPWWRIHVADGNVIRARASAATGHQPIPVNPFHALLSPWSSYPGAPSSNDFIPKLIESGPTQPVSEEIRKLTDSPAQERWELIVLRQSLRR